MDFKKFSKLIMIEQTLFALPFAYIGILFAGGGNLYQWFWATVALAGARTAGMSFNRLLDADIDAENPRTEKRLIPSGEVSRFSVAVISTISCALLVAASYMLNSLCFYLSFAAVFLLFTYSFFKRFSSSAHFYLGFVEAAAPIGGYLAVTGKFDILCFIPGIAIMFWIAGLDIIYSIQDMEHDKKTGLFSVPSKFGKTKALFISYISYIFSAVALCYAGYMAMMGPAYWTAIIAAIIIFIKQQSLARENEENIEDAVIDVFRLNRLISPVIFIGAFVDYVMKNFYL